MNSKKDIRINLSAVAERLNYSDCRRAKNWLIEKNIPIKKTGRENTVFEFLVEYEIQLELAQELKLKYPSTWSEIYESKTTDKNMVKAIMASLPITERRINKTKMSNYKVKFIT